MKFTLIQTSFSRISRFYQGFAKFLPVLSFVGGFAWDSITLNRIDRMSDNLILLGYLILLGLSILLVNLVEKHMLSKPFILRFADWYPLTIQFFLGGLFSSYVVFYFHSASVTKNWLFLGILIILLFANEILEKRLTNIYLQFTLYFLVIYSFMIFFIPVLLKIMNLLTFILSGVLSLSLIAGYLYLFFRKIPLLTRPQLVRISSLILVLFLTINFFYYLNWIPPVPLSLKFGGIFHHAEKLDSDFLLHYEKPPWYKFWKKSDNPFHYTAGDSVYCFAAVFAPVELTKKIIHVWQQQNLKNNRWQETDRLGYKLTGGREGGFRGYTYKKNIRPGNWRVDVATEEGLIVGRIAFTIVEVDSLQRKLKGITY